MVLIRPIHYVKQFAFNAHIRLVHARTIVGRFESPTQTSFHFRAIALDPPPDGDVIGAQAPLGEQLLDVESGRFRGVIRFQTVGLRLDKLFACLNLRYRPLRFINFAWCSAA